MWEPEGYSCRLGALSKHFELLLVRLARFRSKWGVSESRRR